LRAGARFAMSQVINYQGIFPDFRVRNDAISPFRDRQLLSASNSTHFLANFPHFVTHRR
jgi:hypothetical protein